MHRWCLRRPNPTLNRPQPSYSALVFFDPGSNTSVMVAFMICLASIQMCVSPHYPPHFLPLCWITSTSHLARPSPDLHVSYEYFKPYASGTDNSLSLWAQWQLCFIIFVTLAMKVWQYHARHHRTSVPLHDQMNDITPRNTVGGPGGHRRSEEQITIRHPAPNSGGHSFCFVILLLVYCAVVRFASADT